MLTGIRACVFDAYGTLFDVASPVARLASEIRPHAEDISKLWRQKQLEYSWLRSLMGVHADFWHVTGDALDYALEQFNVSEPGLRDELLALYGPLDLPLFTITGFDASAHTSEETVDAQNTVHKGMLTSVFWSLVFGFALALGMVMALPTVYTVLAADPKMTSRAVAAMVGLGYSTTCSIRTGKRHAGGC